MGLLGESGVLGSEWGLRGSLWGSLVETGPQGLRAGPQGETEAQILRNLKTISLCGIIGHRALWVCCPKRKGQEESEKDVGRRVDEEGEQKEGRMRGKRGSREGEGEAEREKGRGEDKN